MNTPTAGCRERCSSSCARRFWNARGRGAGGRWGGTERVWLSKLSPEFHKLQTYREGGLRDATAFAEADGAAWIDGAGRTHGWSDWREWLSKRAGAGKLALRGFPASKRFRPR